MTKFKPTSRRDEQPNTKSSKMSHHSLPVVMNVHLCDELMLPLPLTSQDLAGTRTGNRLACQASSPDISVGLA